MNKQQAQTMSDNQLSFALIDIRQTLKLHGHGTPYHDKLMSDYDMIIDEMARRCAIEYQKRHG